MAGSRVPGPRKNGPWALICKSSVGPQARGQRPSVRSQGRGQAPGNRALADDSHGARATRRRAARERARARWLASLSWQPVHATTWWWWWSFVHRPPSSPIRLCVPTNGATARFDRQGWHGAQKRHFQVPGAWCGPVEPRFFFFQSLAPRIWGSIAKLVCIQRTAGQNMLRQVLYFSGEHFRRRLSGGSRWYQWMPHRPCHTKAPSAQRSISTTLF